jgi:subtilase family serine protease
MRSIHRIVSTAAAGILVAGGLAFATAGPAQAATVTYRQSEACAAAPAGFARCMAIVRDRFKTSPSGVVTPDATTPTGLGADDLQDAYALPSATAGSGRTIAIVDAYDDPNAEADLGVYRSYYGLPACTTANGCFKKVSQTGSTTSLPSGNRSWGEEISLDVDMVSAICPNCKVLLVEATSTSFANLGAAVNEAAALGASAISNSYGGSDSADTSYGAYYNHPGIAVTASSGDSGYGASYPASSHYVTAVGGTTLSTSSNARGWTETAWADAGSGCSTLNTALTGQASFSTGCTGRAEADVSAVADPATGVSVYDSYRLVGKGWATFGGTSASSPQIAAVYGLAGNTASIDNNYPYAHSASLNDVTSGSNGTCPTSQWCTARAGWDGPTGLGTPNGVGAF